MFLCIAKRVAVNEVNPFKKEETTYVNNGKLNYHYSSQALK